MKRIVFLLVFLIGCAEKNETNWYPVKQPEPAVCYTDDWTDLCTIVSENDNKVIIHCEPEALSDE